jgi:GMP synthase (glutamine-hydrolysing)
VFDAGLPILGICYGMQTLAAQLGGSTEAADAREFGHAEVEVVASDRLLGGLNDHPGKAPRLDVWMSHGDRVATAPPGLRDHRLHRSHSGRGDGQRGQALVRRAVPSGSHPHHAGQALLRRFVATSAAAQPCGRRPTSSKTRSPACASRSATTR